MSSIDPIIPGGVGAFGSTPFEVVGGPSAAEASATRTRKTAYSLDGDAWIGLPVGPQFNLRLATEDSDIVRETDSGYRRVYRQFKRSIWRLSFKIQQTDLWEFTDLHKAVRGATTPFYLTLDQTADPIVAIYGRKIAGVLAQGTGDKVIPPILIYEMTIRSEPL